MEILWVYYGYMMIYGNNQWILVIIYFTYIYAVFLAQIHPFFFAHHVPCLGILEQSRVLAH